MRFFHEDVTAMLATLGFGMVATFMTLIMTKRLSALVALILIPTLFGLLGGFGWSLGPMMLDGVRDLAPTGVMLLFAILYFGIMIDAGLFDPLIRTIVRVVHGDPLRITVGTAILALLVSLDGDGTTTYMITVSALLPLYQRMNMDVRKMACIIIMAAAVTNLVPWGGPTARAATALKLDPSDLFIPMIPPLLVTAGWVVLVAYLFGLQERRRPRGRDGSETTVCDAQTAPVQGAGDDGGRDVSWRRLAFILNLLLTATLLVCLMLGALPLPILFMIAFSLALMLNYPTLEQQRQRIGAHAGNALAVVSLIFAAGIFMGILSGTGMVNAMAASVIGALPDGVGPYMAPITALLSIPFTFLISNDAFYFGMLPVLAQTAQAYGLSPQQMACASLIGQQIHLLSPLVPSTYLLVGMSRIEFGSHQRFTLPWALGSCVVLLVTSLLLGVFPLTT